MYEVSTCKTFKLRLDTSLSFLKGLTRIQTIERRRRHTGRSRHKTPEKEGDWI